MKSTFQFFIILLRYSLPIEVLFIANQKYLSNHDRIIIESSLLNHLSFKIIYYLRKYFLSFLII